MLRLAILTLLSHWCRHPGQLLTLLTGLALATALWSGVQAINTEARASYGQAAATLGQDRLERLVTADGQPVPLARYVDLRRTGYRVSPVISGVLRTDQTRLRLLGIDPLTAPEASNAPNLTGEDQIDITRFFGTPGIFLIGRGTDLAPLNDIGPELVITDDVPPGAAITDIATAARLLAQTDPSYLLADPSQPPHLPPLAALGDLQLQPPSGSSDIAQLTDSFHLNLTAFGLLAFAVGLFIVHGAVGLAVEQRRTTVRSLRAMGVPLHKILSTFSLEMAGLALFSCLIGLILGYVIAAALMPGVAGTLRGLYGAEVAGSLRFNPAWAAAGVAMTLGGAMLAATQAFVALARMPLLAPANPRAWAMASNQTIRLQTLAALLLGLIALGLLAFGDGLVAGFGFLAALLIAAALLLPRILTLALNTLSRAAKGVRMEWVLADTRQQIPSLSLALMALMLALAANIGVSTMVGSFRVTFTGWLDQRLASELYLTAADTDQAQSLIPYLEPRTDAILPIISTETPLASRPGEVFGIIDHATYRDHWPLLSAAPDAWGAIAGGTGVLINEQLHRRSGLALGDTLALANTPLLPVVGVYSDYGNPHGQAIIGYDLFTQLFPQTPLRRYALRLPPDQVPQLAADLRETFDLPADAVVNQTQIKRFSLEVFERTFQITGALNILTLSVAGFAMLTSLLTLAGMRLPQLAPVWAVGMTRQTLARIELGRALLLAALTFLIAIPVGLVLAWALLAVVNVEAFGWRLPMRLFPFDWLGLGALALLAAGLAAWLPARRLARMGPDHLLRVFANDR